MNEDPLAPMRSVVVGALVGGLMWAAIIWLVWWVLR